MVVSFLRRTLFFFLSIRTRSFETNNTFNNDDDNDNDDSNDRNNNNDNNNNKIRCVFELLCEEVNGIERKLYFNWFSMVVFHANRPFQFTMMKPSNIHVSDVIAYAFVCIVIFGVYLRLVYTNRLNMEDECRATNTRTIIYTLKYMETPPKKARNSQNRHQKNMVDFVFVYIHISGRRSNKIWSFCLAFVKIKWVSISCIHIYKTKNEPNAYQISLLY